MTLRKSATEVSASLPKLAAFLDDAEVDVLAYVSFPPATTKQSRGSAHGTLDCFAFGSQ
jgi:hypothetical protein